MSQIVKHLYRVRDMAKQAFFTRQNKGKVGDLSQIAKHLHYVRDMAKQAFFTRQNKGKVGDLSQIVKHLHCVRDMAKQAFLEAGAIARLARQIYSVRLKGLSSMHQ